MASSDQLAVTLNNHRTFYSIACRHYRQVKQLVAEQDRRVVRSDEDVDFVCEKNAAIQRSAMVSVIFSALTLEAFINYYGIDRFSRSFFDNHLDNLSTVSKWLILPKLTIGRQLSRDGQPYELLIGLFRLRNKLVHYKTRKKRICDLRGEDWVTEGDADNAIQAVKSLVGELRSLDPTVGVDWLQDAETDPYA